MRIRQVTFISVGCLLAATATLAITGSVVVFDPQQHLGSAQLIDGWEHKQPLLNLAYLWMEIPRIEGAIRITCKNGKVFERGYVTPGMQTWLKIDHTMGCSTGHL